MKGERRTAGMDDLLTPNEGVNGVVMVLEMVRAEQ